MWFLSILVILTGLTFKSFELQILQEFSKKMLPSTKI